MRAATTGGRHCWEQHAGARWVSGGRGEEWGKRREKERIKERERESVCVCVCAREVHERKKEQEKKRRGKKGAKIEKKKGAHPLSLLHAPNARAKQPRAAAWRHRDLSYPRDN